MSSINPDILYEWEEDISHYYPKSPIVKPVELLEVTLFPDGTTSTSKTVLDPASLEVWLTQMTDSGDTHNEATTSHEHSLKLIVVGCDRQRQQDSENPTAPTEQFPIPAGSKAWHFPFSNHVYKLLVDRFKLPRATRMVFPDYSWFYSPSSFHTFTSTSTAEVGKESDLTSSDRIGMTMKFSGSDLVCMDASLSLSHSTTKNSTYGILLCRHGSQASYISDTVLRLASIATHPAGLPTILCTLYQLTVLRQLEDTWGMVFDVESASGLGGMVMTTGNCDDPSLSRKAITMTQLAIAWDLYASRGAHILTSVQTFAKDYATAHQGKDVLSAKQGRILKEYLTLAVERGEYMRYRTKHLLERSRLQVESINNHLAHTSNKINLSLAKASQQIAMDAQRDSSSMKSIAILTMVFLPATYIASLFATPGMSSTSPSQGLYWAVSLPVTAFVLMIWTVWTRKLERDHMRAEKVANITQTKLSGSLNGILSKKEV